MPATAAAGATLGAATTALATSAAAGAAAILDSAAAGIINEIASRLLNQAKAAMQLAGQAHELITAGIR
jgi:hypothetical protein